MSLTIPMDILLSLAAGVVIVLLITLATGYFVAQEFAFLAVDRSKLTALAAAGDDAAERTLQITRRTSYMLSGAQLGITVTGLLVGYVAEPLIGVALADLGGGAGLSMGVALAVGSILALIFSTFVQMLFGELLPKNYAIARSTEVAGRLARSTKLYLTIFGPLIWVFDRSAEFVLRVLRMEPVHDVEHSATAMDLQHVVEESRERGSISPELSALLDRIIDFPSQDVEHAMMPRARVDVVRVGESIGAVRERMAHGHTRYPVLDGEDRIVGVVHLVDVLGRGSSRPSPQAPVSTIMQPPLVLPASMALPDALQELSSGRGELACVVDEYGGFAGIVTREDLAEEVVGELTDEHDPEQPDYVPVPDDGIWVVSGDVHLDEIERSLHIDLADGDYETIAGLVIDAHGALPVVGDGVDIELMGADDETAERVLRAEVLAIEHYVPSRLRLTLPVRERSEGEEQ